MTPLVETVTVIVSVATLAAQVYCLVVIAGLVFSRRSIPSFIRFTGKYALEIGAIVSVSAVLLSMFYSVVAGFEPCTLCWWQRVFMFPQAVIFITALAYKKLKGVSEVAVGSSLALSVIGGLIALYQTYAQTFNQSLLGLCGASGVSCAKLYFVSFGYITIPFMSLVGFVLIALSLIAHIYVSRHA